MVSACGRWRGGGARGLQFAVGACTTAEIEAGGNRIMDLEREYNNRQRVPEHPAIIARWHEDAAAYRESSACECDLAYGASPRAQVDIFHASETARGRGVALFIHGGYWQGLDGKAFSHMARGPNGHGIDVAVATYDLCPAVGVADIVEQMRTCCAWLWHRLGKPMTVYGHSAGGHLSAAMLATHWSAIDGNLPADLVANAYAISGVFDLEPLVATSINDALGLTPETARLASPIHWPPRAGARLVAAVGADESRSFLQQSADICARWGRQGVDAAYVEVPGTNHFTVIDDLADPASEMARAVAGLAAEAAAAR